MSSSLRTSSTVSEMKLKSETACPRNGIYPFTCSIPLGFCIYILVVLNKNQTFWQYFMTKFPEVHLLEFDRKQIFLLYVFLYKRYYFLSHLPVNLEQNVRRLLQYIVMLRGHSSRFLARTSMIRENSYKDPIRTTMVIKEGKSHTTIYCF